jgi:hypothetical protein
MKKTLMLLLVAVASMTVARAQNYDKAVGLRLGYGAALDFKWNLNSVNSLNFNLALPAFHGVTGSAAYQWNWPLGGSRFRGEGFTAYVGPAAGIGYLNMNKYKGFFMSIGAHGGVEYKFNIPLALAVDAKPMLSYVSGNNDSKSGIWPTGLLDIAVVVRYTF